MLVHGRQFLFPRRKEHPPAGLLGDLPERALAFQRDAGDAADADHVHRGARRLRRDERVLHLRLAVLVVPIGDEHDHVPPIGVRHEPRRLDQTVGDRRASAGRDRLHGARDRVAIAGWPGDRSKRLRKRRHDDAIVRPQEVGQPAGSPANELHPGVHALARVHEQRVGDRQRFDAGEVDRLRLVVLEHAERGGVEAADEPIGFVHHGRFEQDSRDARGLENLERRELDRIRRGVAARIGRVDADAGRLERVGVGPLDRIRRTFPVIANQRVVHVEPDRFERHAAADG